MDYLDGNYESFAKDFLDLYLQKGLGSMNKADTEILVYHLLKKYNGISGNYIADSFKLRLNEAKLRKLDYESELKYAEDINSDINGKVLSLLVGLLKKAEVVNKNTKVRFHFNDKLTMNYALKVLADNKTYTGWTKANDFLTLSPDALYSLIYKCISEEKHPVANLKLSTYINGDYSFEDRLKKMITDSLEDTTNLGSLSIIISEL